MQPEKQPPIPEGTLFEDAAGRTVFPILDSNGLTGQVISYVREGGKWVSHISDATKIDKGQG